MANKRLYTNCLIHGILAFDSHIVDQATAKSCGRRSGASSTKDSSGIAKGTSDGALCYVTDSLATGFSQVGDHK